MGFPNASVIIILTITGVSARAISNAMNVEPASTPEPHGRGTFALVTNCLVTYFFCVWTAVHPEIIPKPTTWRTFVNKMTLMVFCIFVPEATIMPAYSQRKEAKRIRNVWLSHWKIDTGDRYDIGLEGAFFVVMGGIGVGKPGKRGECWTILTARGFEWYLQNGWIKKEDLVKDDIIDKGKANTLVKLLVLAQACWFVIVFIGRLLTGFPVTLLEIHVVIQVISASMASFFWFRKPLDVQRPIFLKNIQISQGLNQQTTTYSIDHYYITENAGQTILTEVLRAIFSAGQCVLGKNRGEGKNSKRLYGIAALMAFNGACHAVAYFIQFPTLIERTLWLICSLSICVLPFMWAFLLQHGRSVEAYYGLVWKQRFTTCTNFISHSCEIWFSTWQEVWDLCKAKDRAYSPRWFLTAPLLFLLYLGIVLVCQVYVVCVLYIVSESIYSLRSLPIGSYSTPVWSHYVPQIA